MGGSITAGIGGAGGWQAMAWAAEEAECTGARLVLLHVCATHARSEDPARSTT